MDRAKVTSWTRAAQVTLALAVLFAAGVGLAGFPGSTIPLAPEPIAPPTAETISTKPAPAAEAPAVDVPDIAARLALIGNHPKPIEVVATDAGHVEPPPPAAAELKYLGPIGIGNRKLALMVHAGKQVILGVGDKLPGEEHKITEISDLEVTVEDGAAGKKIERANKSALAFTTISSPAAPAAKAPSGPSDAPMNDNMRDKIRAARDRRAALRGQRQPSGDPEQAEQNPGDAPR
jgi:hypothetical protein